MTVQAMLVLGMDGSTSLGGNSAGITSPADQAQFLLKRRQGDVIIIGGNTARLESYRRTPVPLVVLSHTFPEIVNENPQAHWWNLSPLEAVQKAEREFGPAVIIEGGISLLRQLLSARAISRLDLSVTPISGGENRIDLTELLSHFKVVVESSSEKTLFYNCTEPK